MVVWKAGNVAAVAAAELGLTNFAIAKQSGSIEYSSRYMNSFMVATLVLSLQVSCSSISSGMLDMFTKTE